MKKSPKRTTKALRKKPKSTALKKKSVTPATKKLAQPSFSKTLEHFAAEMEQRMGPISRSYIEKDARKRGIIFKHALIQYVCLDFGVPIPEEFK